MDDTQKQQNQDQQGVQNTSQTASAQSQTVKQPVQQEEWVLPTSKTTAKESEPMPSLAVTPTEAMVPSEPELQLPKEVSETGAEAVSEMPQLTEEDKKVGIEVAKEATPPPVATPVSSHASLTEEDIKKEITGYAIFKDPSRARYWLAMLLQKYFLQRKKEEEKGK